MKEKFSDRFIQDSLKKEEESLKKKLELYLTLYKVERKPKDIVEPAKPMFSSSPIKIKTPESPTLSLEQKVKEDKFDIVYFNPVLKKKEVLESVTKLFYNDIRQEVVDLTLSLREAPIAITHVIYSPLIEKVKQNNLKLEELQKIEVSPILKERDEVVKEIEEQRKAIEELLEASKYNFEEQKFFEKLNRLPPLTKKRIEALVKRGVDKKIIITLLLAEEYFLINLRNFLLSLTPKSIRSIIKKIFKGGKNNSL